MSDGIDYLNTLEQWHGQGSFTNDNVRAVMSSLNNPQDRVKTVHVAGTNGKGSVSAGIASTLGAAGFSVGLTISPPLTKINERIIINGEPIADSKLDQYAALIKDNAVRVGVVLSFFEAITAAAFLAFFENGCEWAVIETGLGGRLDATNIIKRPKLAVITGIDFDHEHVLGHTLEEIAAEKAGIIKKDVPVILGAAEASVIQCVSKIAMLQNAPISIYGDDFSSERVGEQYHLYSARGIVEYRPALSGAHQGHNMALVAEAGFKLGLSKDSIQLGISNVFWPARLEKVRFGDRDTLIDAAHNPGGIKVLINYLKESGVSEIDLGFGALRTKNWRGMLELLKPVTRRYNIMTSPSEMATESREIVSYLSSIGINATDYNRNYGAFIQDHSYSDSRLLVVAGSIYLSGIIRETGNIERGAIWKRCSEKKGGG